VIPIDTEPNLLSNLFYEFPIFPIKNSNFAYQKTPKKKECPIYNNKRFSA